MIRCIGFGEFEGKCGNEHDGRLNPVWCDRCNAIRLAYITAQFEKISEGFKP